MELNIFKDFDFLDFWGDNKNPEEVFLSNELIDSIEKELGYKFPDSYVEFMRYKNGGKPKNDTHSDTVEITELMGIGRNERYSLCGEFGNKFMIKEWGYPNIGIYICTCPSAGHDMVILDYSELNENNEPKVAHIDQELGYEKKIIANDFETFIRQLESYEDFHNDDDWSEEDTDGFDICF